MEQKGILVIPYRGRVEADFIWDMRNIFQKGYSNTKQMIITKEQNANPSFFLNCSKFKQQFKKCLI